MSYFLLSNLKVTLSLVFYNFLIIVCYLINNSLSFNHIKNLSIINEFMYLFKGFYWYLHIEQVQYVIMEFHIIRLKTMFIE